MPDKTKNQDIDIRQREVLDKALEDVDRVVMRKYEANLVDYPVFIPSYDVTFEIPKENEAEVNTVASDDNSEANDKAEDNQSIPVCIVGTNAMLMKLTRIVYDKDENIQDKLTTVYNATSLYEKASLLMLIKSDGKNADIYLGTVCKKSDDSFVPQKQIEAFRDNLLANFPGSEAVLIDKVDEKVQIIQSIFEKKLCVASVTGVGALKDKDIDENSNFIQGLEKLIDSLNGKKCTVMIIADPVVDRTLNEIKSGYEELYTALIPFAKSEFSVNKSNGKSVTDSVITGVTDTTNESLAKTKSHTNTKGTNSSHTVGGSLGVNVGATGTVSVTPFGVGASASATVGVSTTADYHYMHGHHEDNSETNGETQTTGTSKALTNQNSIANALSENSGEGLQITYENRSVKSVVEKIDKQIKRMEECEDYGMYDCGVYFLSEDYATCLSSASTYKSLMQGEESAVETSIVNVWDQDAALPLIPYLATFNHPIFNVSLKENDPFSASPSTLVSGKELAIHMGLPRKSISGIPVIECAAFGRNVFSQDYLTKQGCQEANEDNERTKKDDSISIGVIHHMNSDTDVEVELSKKSLTAHAFVTGSTGSGKSNTMYELINKICLCKKTDKDLETTFMVIEPAKGEYKDVLGGNQNVSVFGTNPRNTNMLKINPFSFPDKILVLEHIDRLIEIFNVCWPMYAAMPAVLKEAIERAYKNIGWNLETSEFSKEISKENLYPTFIDVLEEINNVLNESKYSADSKGDYVGALSMRVGSLTNGIIGQILCSDGITDSELFDKNVIVDLSRVGSSETKSLIMGLLVIKLQEYRIDTAERERESNEKKSINRSLRHITVLEEAHNLLKRTSTEQSSDSSNLAGKSVEMLANSIAEMRTYGEGFIIVDQSPGLMDMSVIRNTNTKIILRLPDISDRDLVGKAANLNDEQIVELAKLRTGVADIYQNNWVEPVLCHIKEWNDGDNKPYSASEEVIFDNLKFKKQVIELVMSQAEVLDENALKPIKENVFRARISSKLKLNILKLLNEKDKEKKKILREKIVYEIFSPDVILEKNLCYRNDIKEWQIAMHDALIPNLEQFDSEQQEKILAILAYEKSVKETRQEYDELIQNLLNYIERKRMS